LFSISYFVCFDRRRSVHCPMKLIIDCDENENGKEEEKVERKE
jgi:hypothetical protein